MPRRGMAMRVGGVLTTPKIAFLNCPLQRKRWNGAGQEVVVNGRRRSGRLLLRCAEERLLSGGAHEQTDQETGESFLFHLASGREYGRLFATCMPTALGGTVVLPEPIHCL